MMKFRGRLIGAAAAALAAAAAYGDSINFQTINSNLPIPGALLLFGLALAGLGVFGVRRRKSGPAA